MPRKSLHPLFQPPESLADLSGFGDATMKIVFLDCKSRLAVVQAFPDGPRAQASEPELEPELTPSLLPSLRVQKGSARRGDVPDYQTWFGFGSCGSWRADGASAQGSGQRIRERAREGRRLARAAFLQFRAADNVFALVERTDGRTYGSRAASADQTRPTRSIRCDQRLRGSSAFFD
ncbi:hypothetical protein DFH11DRAFT_1729826 [Phellopilus nigrolimitatus]|nr:hypothetical protein DFH11DRAFT_1729826 [Phellopilus nigrolimitatus]